jgi:hypothetical protein
MFDRSARASPHQRKVCNFVGRRKELNTLLVTTLKIRSKGVGVLSVQGEGGPGKSMLLRQFDRFLHHDEAFSHIRSSFVDFGVRLHREEWAPLVWVRNDLAVKGSASLASMLGSSSSGRPRSQRVLHPTWNMRGFGRHRIRSFQSLMRSTGSTVSGGQLHLDDAAILQQVPFLKWVLTKARRIVADEELAGRLVLAKASLSALF